MSSLNRKNELDVNLGIYVCQNVSPYLEIDLEIGTLYYLLDYRCFFLKKKAET